MAGDVSVRALRTLEEIAPLETLQSAIWGYDGRESHVYPARGLFALVESGGLVGGAYDNHGALVGFSAAWIGREHDRRRLYLHSQIVGVLEHARDRGVGRLLKLQQRDFALAHDLRLVKWTFDPLRPRNAHFNLHKLGAIARRFVPNYYGRLGGTLNAGRDTDRLWAEWHVGSAHVERRLHAEVAAGAPPAGAPVNRLARQGDAWAVPEFRLDLTAPTLLLELPLDLDADPDQTTALVRGLQPRLRATFEHYLPAYAITDCVRLADRLVYVLHRDLDADLTDAASG